MYHHKPQSQGPQSFANMSRPDHNHQHQQPPNQRNPGASNMLSAFSFPRPTQLPEELESALAIRGARDTDHRLADHTSRPPKNQNLGTVSVVSQHGSYCSGPTTLTSDNLTSRHHNADWSNFQPPTKLFANSASDGTCHSQQLQGLHQQAQTNRSGLGAPSWVPSGPTSSQAKQLHSAVGDGQGLYTPESAGSILASFGLSNDDLEVLSHYPDDQLTPDTLPFILRDIQINKSDNRNTVACNTHGKILPPSDTSQPMDTCPSEVPSLLTVTKTAGKVIDYGHASRAKENTTKQTFKREKLSNERVVQMYSSSASPPKIEKAEKRHIRLVHMDSSTHGDRDYRKTSGDHHKSSLSQSSEGPPYKSRIVDKDYRNSGAKQRSSSETRRELYSRRSRSPSPGTSGFGISKKSPDSTFICDFSGTSPKVFPHSCSLCHIQCDHNKDWVDHINTVNHTAACRDLRNKYPDWKPDLKSKSRVEPHRLHTRPHSPQDHRQHHCTGDSSHHSGLKRPYNDLNKHSADTSCVSKADQSSKYGKSHSSTKTVKKSTKPGTETKRTANAKAADPSSNPPPAKKKKETVAPASQDASIAGRQDDPTGIPKKKTEQEVNKLVASYGEINSVNFMPNSEKESQKGDGQKIPEPQHSSVCSNSEPPINPDKGSEKKYSVSEADMNTSAKGLVLITGIPDGDWSESEVIKLIQPFGNPTDIISASSLGKALVSVPNLKTAQEVVKAHISIPAKIKDCDLKIVDIKEHVGIDTPVALYNLLMQSLDPLESSSPVSWSSLLVINNVPDTPTGAREVKQLVRRFGTVVKTLELNNMVICEMATSAMALSVYKRFQRFPCIIQNNPLFFSHKPDPKASTPTQVLSSNPHSPEAIHAITEDGITDTADQDKKAFEENVSVDMEIGPDGLMGPQKVATADESLEEKGSLVTHEPRNVQSESALQPHTKTDKENVSSSNAVLKSDEKDASANETILLTTENVAELEKNKTVGHCTSTDVSSTEFSKDIPETQNGARTNQHPNKMAGSANEDLLETMGEKTHCQIKETDQQKVIDGRKLTLKNHAEGGLKTKERERITKEAKQEKEPKESERKIRRVQEKLQRAKRDSEQEDRTKREVRAMERKEELVQSSELSSSCRFETCKRNSNVDQQRISNKSDAELPKMDEGEDFESFPLSMGDFVTVDEVGDVTALTDFPHTPSPAPPEKIAEQEQSLTFVPLDTHEVTPLDEMKGVIAQSMKSDVPKTNCQLQPMTSEDPIVDVGHQPPTSARTSDSVSSDVIGMLSCKIVTPSAQTRQELCPVNQKVVATFQPEKNETETIASVPTECMVIVETLPTSISISTAVIDAITSDPHTIEVKMTSGKNTTGNATEEKQKATPLVNSPLNDGQTLTERTQEMEKVQMKEDTWISLPSDEPGRGNISDIPVITDEKSKEKPLTETPMTTDTVHFDPSMPVGMEFLVPKTGFFCKVCNRFFSGSKDTQITHCKSLKHFENLQKSRCVNES
uniref:Uncharacterized LOC109521704 n=1 Tax=Hippocampus comes TaxID=109280 RepID=A0A3Q2YH95_HIPCM